MQAKSTDDRQLVHRALQGHKRAYGRLIENYKNLVYATLCARVRRPEDVEDLAQDVFLKAYQRLDTLPPESPLWSLGEFTWLPYFLLSKADPVGLRPLHNPGSAADDIVHVDRFSMDPRFAERVLAFAENSPDRAIRAESLARMAQSSSGATFAAYYRQLQDEYGDISYTRQWLERQGR